MASRQYNYNRCWRNLGIFQRGIVSTEFLYLVIILRNSDKLFDSIGHYLAEEDEETQSNIIVGAW